MTGSIGNVGKISNAIQYTPFSGPGKRLLQKFAAPELEFQDLHQDLICAIFLYLRLKDIRSCSMTCTRTYQITKDPTLWQLLWQRDFPLYPLLQGTTMEMYHNLYGYSSNLVKGVYASYRINNDGPLRAANIPCKFAVFEEKLFASFANGEIKVLDLKTQECLKTIGGNPGRSNSLVIAPGKLIAAYGGTIKIWDLKTWDCIKIFEGYEDQEIRALTHYDGMLVSSAFDGEIKFWDLKTGNHLSSLRGGLDGVSSIAQDREKLFIGSENGMIKVWDLKNTICLKSLDDQHHILAIRSLLIAEGKLISGDNAGNIKIWDLETYKCELTLQVNLDGIFSLAFEDGKLFISTYCKSEIVIWDFKAKDEQVTLELIDLFMSDEVKDVGDAGDRYVRLPKAMKEKIDRELALKQTTGYQAFF